jgi:hypothetical protein
MDSFWHDFFPSLLFDDFETWAMLIYICICICINIYLFMNAHEACIVFLSLFYIAHSPS